MNVRKWKSNSKDFLDSIKEGCPKEDEKVQDPTTKVLGVLWNTKTDQLAFKIPSVDSISTRREIYYFHI